MPSWERTRPPVAPLITLNLLTQNKNLLCAVIMIFDDKQLNVQVISQLAVSNHSALP